MKRVSVMVVLLLSCAVVFAQGGKETKKTQRTVTTVCRASYATEEWYNRMNEAFEAETGIHVDVQPTPGNDADHDAKVNIDLLAGSKIDVIPSLGSAHYSTRVDAGYFMPLNDLVKEVGFDAHSVFGANLPIDEDGTFVGLPFKLEVWCTFFNKDLFDRAGVPYPSGQWTWDEFVQTARKVADRKNGIYGFLLHYEVPWLFLPGMTSRTPLYKVDGSSNFDAPEHRAGAQFYYDYSVAEQLSPTVKELAADNASWNYWAIAGDNIAMFLQGNWFTRLLISPVDYPRTWRYGVAPMPGETVLTAPAYVSINKNAVNKEEALEYVIWLANNQWKYEGGLPAMATLTEEERNQVFGALAESSNGQVTVDELYYGILETGLTPHDSDIVGVAAGEYTTIVMQELQAFNMDLQSLDSAVTNIVNRANEAIKNAQ
jgi:multiple sugar transport system substrate-binding protein